MYSIHRQLHPITGLEHCVYCRFFDYKEENLVVAGVNNLQVFKLNTEVEAVPKSNSEKNGEKLKDPKSKKQKLECLATFQLVGNITSMQSVQLASANRDALLLSFQDAKLSLVEYDPSTNDLKTLSMHYFEEEELKDGHLQQSVNKSIVRVDPEGRCAAMMIYGTRLVVLPFRKDGGGDEDGILGVSKPPILSSYIIDLRKLDEKIINVVDVQFLHGYYEPTVFILYEPLPTWTGRVAVRKDSCSVVAISLNIQEKVHPIIWSLGNLPFDCLKAFPLMKPIGGVILFAVNSLLYLNQSFPPYGVSLNSLTDFSSDFLLKPQDGVKISLDCAHGTFIAVDKMVISLKGGELYVLSLIIDGMRAVRSFNLDKAAASVLTTCMCVCGESYLFLGSRLGNSLLLKYTEKQSDLTNGEQKTVELLKKDREEPPTKKRKETVGDWMASDVSALDDLDELEVYGNEAQQPGSGQITSYNFEVCDSIMNIGPCGQMVMGEPAFLSEEFGSSIDPDIELVTTSGFGKNGAISVLQRTIRPQVVTTFELPGCTDMWTVVGHGGEPKSNADTSDKETETEETEEKKENETEKKEEKEEPENTHALLIISRDDSSMILQTGQEIMELDHSGFSTQGPTICAGNIGDNKFIIQVSPMGVRLMEGVNQVQHIPIDIGSPIVGCSIADPHVVIVSQDGHIMLLTLRQDSFGSGVRLAVSRPQTQQKSKAIALCAFKDESGLFITDASADPSSSKRPEVLTPKVVLIDPISEKVVIDEDELLYGDSIDQKTAPSTPAEEAPKLPTKSSTDETQRAITPTFWAAVSRENGILEMYSLPDFKRVFLVKNFPMGQKVLVDSGQQTEISMMGQQEKILEIPLVKELLLVGLGNKCSRPYLMARVDDEVLIYEAFPFYSAVNDGHLQLRFKKLSHGLILKEKKSGRGKKGKEEYDGIDSLRTERVGWLRQFSDISGYSGVFICGPYPHWIFMTARGCLRIHPMSIDGTVTCFTPFHNVNCPKGFLYFNRQGELRISVLPTHLSYDAPWPVRKVPLRCTPHFVTYHPETKTYAVATSTLEICDRVVKVIGDGEKEFETQERDDRFILPTIERFSIQLFSPVSWEPIPNTRFEFDEFEHVTCVKVVNLVSEGTLSGLKGYVAVGSNYNYNEEVTSRGRILVFDVIEVVPEPGQPLTKNKMKIEYNKDQKGPVTALGQVNGYLVTAIGQKVYIWQLKHDELSGVAFIDTQVYIHSMVTIKNLILVGDIFKSICLMRYQTDLKVLSMVSRDVKPLEVYSIEYLVDNTTLCFLVSDRMKNVIVFTYQPEQRESVGGLRLLRRADFHIGSCINTFFRISCKLSDPSTDKQMTGPLERRHVTFYATLDGSIGYIMPITEKVYRRLQMLQNALNTQIQHTAGLNPKSYRLLKQEHRMLANTHRNILDGDLLWKYLNLSNMEKNELAKKIGTSCEQLTEDLMEIDRATAHF